jgi:hypothetical protein
MEPALGGLYALAGVILGGLVAIAVEARRTSGQMRAYLFERRFEGYGAVIAELSDLNDWMIQIAGNVAAGAWNPGLQTNFRNESAARVNRVATVMQRHALAIDQSGAIGVLGYLGMVKAAGEGTQPMPSIDVLGTRFGQAVDACHRALSIPELARETYRQSARLGGRRHK